jgi:hypothetical protein
VSAADEAEQGRALQLLKLNCVCADLELLNQILLPQTPPHVLVAVDMATPTRTCWGVCVVRTQSSNIRPASKSNCW